MTSTQLWPALVVPVLNGMAFLLALGFRRNRAVMLLAILTIASLALASHEQTLLAIRGEEAIRMFAPWLLLAAAAVPERRLLARGNLALLAMLAMAIWLTLAAPVHIWPLLRDVLPLGWLDLKAGLVGAGLVFAAAILCWARWLASRVPMESALGFVLILVAIALLPTMRAGAILDLLAIAGALAIAAILFTSYRMAFVDGLAGLPNRRALDEALARLSGDFMLAMVDVDHFKAFNDRHGHAAGDRVLQAVANQLKATRGANAYRYGGEEFCLVFTGAGMRQAEESCEELRERVESMRVKVRSTPARKRSTSKPTRDSSTVSVTISIGLAARSPRGRDSTEVLKAADKALYAAKAKGRNRVVAP